MSEVKLSKGSEMRYFYVFDNGNALEVVDGELHTFVDFAKKYIKLREEGYENA